MQLNDKVAVVTGAASGINRAIAARFALEGASVIVADIDEPGGRETMARIASAGGRAIAVRTDVRRRDEVEAMVQRAVGEFGGVNVLVNGAGIETLVPFLDMPDEDWNRVLSVNLTGSFVCGQIVAREMVRAGRGGKIVNIASINAAIALPKQAHYVASKGGLLMLTKAMALELAPHGINVNAIGPGAVETPLTAGSLADPVRREMLVRHIPLGRIAQPDDIAGAAVFLCSDAANYITGTILYVDGGWLIS